MKKIKDAWDWIVAAGMVVLAIIGALALSRKNAKPVPGRKRLMHQIQKEQDQEKQDRQNKLNEATLDAWRKMNEGDSADDGVSYLAELYKSDSGD